MRSTSVPRPRSIIVFTALVAFSLAATGCDQNPTAPTAPPKDAAKGAAGPVPKTLGRPAD